MRECNISTFIQDVNFLIFVFFHAQNMKNARNLMTTTLMLIFQNYGTRCIKDCKPHIPCLFSVLQITFSMISPSGLRKSGIAFGEGSNIKNIHWSCFCERVQPFHYGLIYCFKLPTLKVNHIVYFSHLPQSNSYSTFQSKDNIFSFLLYDLYAWFSLV